METFRISVLVSGNGSNLQCIIDAVEDGRIANSKIVGVISSSENAYALERARQHEIPAAAVTKYEYADMRDRMDAILKILDGEHPDLIVLAGYLSILPAKVVEKYRGRIINIHPALLPKFGGKDFYGIHVHEAVLAAGEKESGATVHYVDEGVDTGKIILQEKVPVLPGDDPQTLRERVLEIEHKILPEAIAMIEKARH
ncbi:MAG: phosphoribosylglycinamide formyltransferase [Firmicutes bacterium]|jgi:phosphoribosylglycinamide formyltransferase-1|nr:phosphoribosylglycinamide formyltransferase [Bacillota bacterium]MBQ3964409.1 phosphoribosylglycinamide formyltransferase [Bacillota bacterium]